MPVSNSVIRRYTPPTCTLEVLAQSSALSRWMGKSVLKELSFELRFDDPQLPEEKKIALRGDRDQLEALYAAVTNYVQQFLQMSSEDFWVISGPKDSSKAKASDDPEAKYINHSGQQTNILNSFSTQMPAADIHIQPSSYLTHNLFLGSLANPASGAVIQLSLLQLFDLATALDEYSADVLALPTLNPRSTDPSLPSWTPIAAVLVLGVGLIPITLQYANSSRQQQTAKKTTPAQEKIALESSPPSIINLSTPIPTLTPPDSLPALQSPLPLSSNLPLPGSSLPSTTQTPSSSLPATSQLSPSPQSSLPSAFQTSPNLTTLPSATLPSSTAKVTIPQTSAQTRTTSPSNTSPLTLPNQTNPRQNGTASITQGGISVFPETSNLPPTTTISPSISTLPPPLANIPSSNSDVRPNPADSPPNPSVPGNANSLATRLREGRNNSKTTSTQTATNSGTLFDTPQVAEARDFLKKRWQPPSSLKQTIEYSLILSVDGSIERILPLGKAARDYVDRTGMPLIGERFVSPNINGQSVRIRAVFSPDGKVQTFPETE